MVSSMFGNALGNFGGFAQNAISGMKQVGQMASDAEMIMQLVRAYKGGGNPMQMLGQMAQSNPQMGQAMQMLQGKSPDQIKTMVQNMANEQGIDLNALAAQFGLQIPK